MAFSKEKAHERAERFAAKGQHDKAAREYQSIVENDPKDVRAWLMLADCLVRCGDRAGAISRYVQVAEFYARQKQPPKALAVFRQVLNLDPGRVDVHLKCASLNLQLGRVQDAIASYEHVAHAQLQGGHVADALQTYRVIADADPTVVSKRLRLAELYSRERMLPEAVEAFRAAGDQLLAAQRHADYVRVAERLLYHKPDDRPTIRQIARVYLALGDPRRALMKLNGLLQADQHDREGLELLGETFMALGKPDKAVSVLAELVRELRKAQVGSDQIRRAIDRGLSWDPDNAELQRLHYELVGGGPPQAAAPEPAIEVAEPDGGEEEVMELDDAEVVELDDDDVELAESDGVAVPVPAAESVSMTASVLEEVDESEAFAGEGATDLDKILFEARVYVKYRLFDHALDHIQELLDQDPHHMGALALRARALTELDRVHDAADTHVTVARLVADRDPKLAREHLLAALNVVPEHAGAMALRDELGGLDVVPATPSVVPPAGTPHPIHADVSSPLPQGRGDSGAFDLLEEEPDFSIEVSEPEEPAPEAAPPEVENRFGLSDAGPLPDEEDDEDADAKTPPHGFVPRAPAEETHPRLERPGPGLGVPGAVVDTPTREAPVGMYAGPGTPEPVEDVPTRDAPAGFYDESGKIVETAVTNATAVVPAGGHADLSDDLAEIRFYVDQGLEDDARAALADLRARHPGHPELEAAQAELDAAGAPPEEEGAAPLLDLATEEDEEADAYLSAIFSESAPAKAEKKSKAGAVANVDEADARTHFDVGMAYKEMGLVDAAIEQFVAAARDPAWQSRALVMAGTLRVHRGETDQAASDLRRALDTATTEDERSEASYELGVLYERIGDAPAAIEHLSQVSAGFRDRDERLDALRGP